MAKRPLGHRSFVTRPLSFERLQQRSMLAGNVSAFVDRGTLIVNGDVGDNELRITQVGKDMVQLESMSSPTTINNRTGVAVFKVTKGYNFNMGGGNDVLQFDGVKIRSINDLVVDMGVGDDNLQFNNVNVIRTRALLGAGHDSATVTNSRVERSLNIFGDTGDDQITLSNSKFGEKSVVDGNEGANFINQSNVKFGRKSQSVNLTSGTRPNSTTNSAPVGVADSGAINEGSIAPATGNVLTNDTDADGPSKTVSAVKGVAGNVGSNVAGAHGTFNIDANGDYSYTLDTSDAAVNALAAGVTLTDVISYTVSDGIATSTVNLTITITGINNAPTGTDKTITTNEDTAYTLTAADFGFGDATDSPANTLSAVKITTLTTAGSLTLNSVAVTVGQTITLADITGGLLKWTPPNNTSGNALANFTFQVQDNGGTANGGVDLDASANTITFNVNASNDAPTGTDKTITAIEDTAYTFTVADFGFGDANDTPANTLLAVKITTLPTTGSLTLNNVAVTVGQSIAVADITGGLLKWTPASNASGNALATFTFQVQDNGGTTNGGIDLDASANTITFNVTAVNDAPTGTDKTITAIEDTAYTFTAADFGFGDANDTPANTLLAVKITTLPNTGSLTLNNVAVTVGQSIAVSDITGGLLKWTPASDASGNALATFTFQVQDNGDTANGGIDLDQSANTITLDVTAVNDAPTGTDKTITTNEDTAYTFTVADFGFGDATDTPANTLLAVKITTLPTTGSLTLNNVAVTVGQSIAVADITGGLLKWTPASDASGNALATFTFQVQDDGGTANSGVDLDASANTITFDVTAVNDAPAGTNNTITTNLNTAHTLTVADFGFVDANDTPANALFAVVITSLPATGSLTLDGDAVTVNQVIAVADITGGLLVWTPANNQSGTGVATFGFEVVDDGGTANGGIDRDPSANTIAFDVNP